MSLFCNLFVPVFTAQNKHIKLIISKLNPKNRYIETAFFNMSTFLLSILIHPSIKETFFIDKVVAIAKLIFDRNEQVCPKMDTDKIHKTLINKYLRKWHND
ncbi:hypothetical protein D0T66_03060 [Dysgonomonas sp. 25]|nr:hypothetical protein [Dysgonomonas sp. 25]